jgi:hypothetical protein
VSDATPLGSFPSGGGGGAIIITNTVNPVNLVYPAVPVELVNPIDSIEEDEQLTQNREEVNPVYQITTVNGTNESNSTNPINSPAIASPLDTELTVPNTINTKNEFVSSLLPQYARVCEMLTSSPYLAIFLDRGICQLFSEPVLSPRDISLASMDAGG